LWSIYFYFDDDNLSHPTVAAFSWRRYCQKPHKHLAVTDVAAVVAGMMGVDKHHEGPVGWFEHTGRNASSLPFLHVV
jgi:hypothetical protein